MSLYHIRIDLSDVDRDVYQALDLRVARHPSETMHYLLTRVIAYCLSYEDGIAFSKGGLSANDEPAIATRDPRGNLLAWIEIGTPSIERLHKASKASPRVAVFTHHDPELLRRAARGKVVHRAETIQIAALDPTFLDELEAVTGRNARWTLVHTEGSLFVTSADGDGVTTALSSTVARSPLRD